MTNLQTEIEKLTVYNGAVSAEDKMRKGDVLRIVGDFLDHLTGDVYQAIIKECEALEHKGVYAGNGHHLAQRLSAMVQAALTGKDS